MHTSTQTLPHGLGQSATCEIRLFLTPHGIQSTRFRTVDLKYANCSLKNATEIHNFAQSIFDATTGTVEVAGGFCCDTITTDGLVTTQHTTRRLVFPREQIQKVSYYQYQTTNPVTTSFPSGLVAIYPTPATAE